MKRCREAVAAGLVESRGQGASQTEKLSASRSTSSDDEHVLAPSQEVRRRFHQTRAGTHVTHEEKQPGLGPQDP